MMLFNQSYICCACGERVAKENTYTIYKRSCICRGCTKKLEYEDADTICAGEKNISFVLPVFRYKGLYRKIFLGFKFFGNYAYGHILGYAVSERLEAMRYHDGLRAYDCIVPVPLSKQRLRERGYNQSELMASYISEKIGVPMRKHIVRCKHCIAQSTLPMGQRAENVAGAFSVNERLDGQRIILFDDIYTTGATAAECAKTLKKAGAKEVCIVCAAREMS